MLHDGKVRRSGKQVVRFAVMERAERRRRPGSVERSATGEPEGPMEKEEARRQARLARVREAMDAPAFIRVNIKTGVVEVDRVLEVLGF